MPAGIEIERKFLPPGTPADLGAYPAHELEQGYLALGEDGVEVRLRRRDRATLLTVKSAGSGSRTEEEIAIDERQFRSLWPLTQGRRISKTRYEIPAPAGLTIEFDVYHEALDGLLVAEIEFDSPDQASAFTPPAWLGPDVTDDARYKNKALAVQGRPA